MFRIIAIISLALLSVACGPSLSSFDKNVNKLITGSCNFEAPCEIRIGDATNFDWDEMYIFRPGILNGEAKAILPAVNGFKGEFNRKIAFIENEQLVGVDEAASIIEGEHTPPGMLFFDIDEPGNPDCLRFLRDAVFRVTTEKSIRGNVYRLKCTNCSSSPVFAEFGASSQ